MGPSIQVEVHTSDVEEVVGRSEMMNRVTNPKFNAIVNFKLRENSKVHITLLQAKAGTVPMASVEFVPLNLPSLPFRGFVGLKPHIPSDDDLDPHT